MLTVFFVLVGVYAVVRGAQLVHTDFDALERGDFRLMDFGFIGATMILFTSAIVVSFLLFGWKALLVWLVWGVIDTLIGMVTREFKSWWSRRPTGLSEDTDTESFKQTIH